ncbi:MAG TPA: glycosyltransferase family 4 protein [Terriglobia bacterium]|nr:glycosyltransferase family 4 protein [Terriglobia bacterium]
MRHLLPFVDMSVVAPVPYFPRINVNQRWYNLAGAPHAERFAGFEVDHPRYLVVPRIGMTTHGISMFAGSLPRVWRRLRAADYDLIDAHYIYPDGLAAVMLGSLLKKPVVVSARGSDINLFPKYKAIRPMVRHVLKRADAVIAVSRPLKDIMVEIGCSPEKITVVPNGVDPVKFNRQPWAESRQKLGLKEDRPIVLSVGHLNENKGFQILIEAAALLRRLRPEVMLVIIGEGAYRGRLERQVRRLGLENHVALVGARRSEELATWYSAADLFCLASEREGCPNVLLEAIACGCPVIATRVGGTVEIVESPSLGTLVERTPTAFESAIEQALRRPWDRAAIAAHGQSYRWDKVADSILKIYTQVVDNYKN